LDGAEGTVSMGAFDGGECSDSMGAIGDMECSDSVERAWDQSSVAPPAIVAVAFVTVDSVTVDPAPVQVTSLVGRQVIFATSNNVPSTQPYEMLDNDPPEHQ
jgi:hypothetical protein